MVLCQRISSASLCIHTTFAPGESNGTRSRFLAHRFTRLLLTRADLHGQKFRDAPGRLHGLHSILSREPAHQHRQLSVGCHLDGSSIKPQNILRPKNSAAVHFDNKFCILHDGCGYFNCTRKNRITRAKSLAQQNGSKLVRPILSVIASSQQVEPTTQSAHSLRRRALTLSWVSFRIARTSSMD